ncbi:MAG TPA: ribosome recycling factor [Pyrinomonadaceae bacterium]|jgi:ribosome recycling factor|nr:ribosome recycling factor [Pyrinomonadaceae bacterium]
MSVDTVLNDTRPKMESVVEDFKRKLSNVRTGRASVGLLDSVHVDYYGTSTPLNQMASVAVPEPQLITVQPWDISQVNAVEKAIIAANLGLNPSNDGKMIRLPIPPLNEERRKQLAKQVNEIAEDHRVAIRNVRHASNDVLKKMLKDKEISEDDERGGLEKVQKLTNDFIGKIDELSKNKENEIMSV